MGKKEMLAQMLLAARVLPVARRLPLWKGQELRILAYHRVFDIVDESLFPFDPELISASSEVFREQLQHVARCCSPVTFAEVLAAVDGGRRLPRRPVVISFDDGHADNYTHAFPVLRELGIPATIFLSTAYIGGEQVFWFEKVAYCLFRAPTGPLDVPGLAQSLLLSDVPSRRRAVEIVLEHLKYLPDADRRKLVDWLSVTLCADIRSEDRPLSGAMTWEQVREMAGAGIEFGSHAVTHPILTQLDDAALEYELVDSRKSMEANIGRPVEIIAYPVGGERAFDARIITAVKRAGYRLGLSYVSGTNDLRSADRYSLRRLHVERYTSRAWFQSMLEFPRLFS